MLILIGPSASGKTEVAKLLAKKYNISKIVTYTTRKPRINEVDGVDYNFITLEQFADLSSENFFVETTYYNSNYYGTSRKDIKDDKCIILDPNGLKSFTKLNDSHIVSIYLSCDEKTRYKRMIKRNDNENEAKQRIINDRIAFNENNMQGINFVVDSDNKSIDSLCDEIKNLYYSVIRTM